MAGEQHSLVQVSLQLRDPVVLSNTLVTAEAAASAMDMNGNAGGRVVAADPPTTAGEPSQPVIPGAAVNTGQVAPQAAAGQATGTSIPAQVLQTTVGNATLPPSGMTSIDPEVLATLLAEVRSLKRAVAVQEATAKAVAPVQMTAPPVTIAPAAQHVAPAFQVAAPVLPTVRNDGAGPSSFPMATDMAPGSTFTPLPTDSFWATPLGVMAKELCERDPDMATRMYLHYKDEEAHARVRRNCNMAAWSNPTVKLSRSLPPIAMWDGKCKIRQADTFLSDVKELAA